MIYLDNAATTKIDSRVLVAMKPFLKDEYGNAGTLYSLGISARKAVENARKQVAWFINARPEQIVFTSGGTESNNMVFHDAMFRGFTSGNKKIIISSIEHDSIMNSAEFLQNKCGFFHSKIRHFDDGKVDLEDLFSKIDEDTTLVSIQMMNNEIGSINDVDKIAKICNERRVPFHCDSVQAAGCLEIDVKKMGCDFLSVSGHKIHGPKGTGFLYVKNPQKFTPMIHGGGGQEHGLRGGTENVAGIVGLGKACELETGLSYDDRFYTTKMKLAFWYALEEQMGKNGTSDILHENASSAVGYGKTLNIRFDGVDAETLVLVLSSKNVCISAGSACRSHESNPSRVLTAIGLTKEQARNSIRISFSRMNTFDECEKAGRIVADTATELYKM